MKDIAKDAARALFEEVDTKSEDEGVGVGVGNTKQVTTDMTDGVTDREPVSDNIEIGHLEINEYYRVWLEEPESAPPEVQVYPSRQAQTEPPVPEATHFYDAPFDVSVSELELEDVGKALSTSRFDTSFPTENDIDKSQISEIDTCLLKAISLDQHSFVTPTTVRTVKSPLTLFFAAKSLPDNATWERARLSLTDEIERRDITGIDKIQRAEAASVD
jgi:hypothetical protein